MTYDEGRISDQIDGGLQLKEEIYNRASEMYENMFLAMPSNVIISSFDHKDMAKKCAKLAFVACKYCTSEKQRPYYELLIKAVDEI